MNIKKYFLINLETHNIQEQDNLTKFKENEILVIIKKRKDYTDYVEHEFLDDFFNEYNVAQYILPFLSTSKLRNSIVSVGSAVFSFYVVFNYKIEPLLEFNPDIINDVVTELFYELQTHFESTFSAYFRYYSLTVKKEMNEKENTKEKIH